MNQQRLWFAFGLLSLAWGTSFLFIKIALETLQPFTLVGFRLLIGFAGLLVVLRMRRESLPRGRQTWRHLVVLGLFNTAVPFVLFTWSESGPGGVDSAVAAILNSLVPLFSILLAGVVLRTEPVTAGRAVGLVVGFGGVLVLLSRNLSGATGDIPHHLAGAAAALCYAVSAIYARRHLQHVRPVPLAAGQLLVADLAVWLAALLFERGSAQSLTLPTVGALLWLGLLGSCLAYILYFMLLQNWGATRATLVTYVLPVVGVAAGALVLSERVDWRLLVGGGLILSGVAAVNWQPRRARLAQSP